MERVESLSHTKWECKYRVVCGMDTEVSQEVIVRGIEKVFGIDIQRPRYAEGMSGD
jgi:hypothetical protein